MQGHMLVTAFQRDEISCRWVVLCVYCHTVLAEALLWFTCWVTLQAGNSEIFYPITYSKVIMVKPNLTSICLF